MMMMMISSNCPPPPEVVQSCMTDFLLTEITPVSSLPLFAGVPETSSDASATPVVNSAYDLLKPEDDSFL